MTVAADLTYGMAALAGVVSFLSPCVLPIVPAYLSFVAGQSLERIAYDGASDPAAERRVFAAAVAFVLGFATVFVLLGASASAVNALVLRHVDVIGKVAGLVIAAFGVHYTGLIRIPFLNREARIHPDAPAGLVGAFGIGLAFAFGWTPCIGPILAAILTVAAANESLTYGVTLLGTYAAGLGIPFLIAAAAIRPFTRFLKRFRRHIRKVEIATGLLLVATGVAIFTGDLSRLAFFLLEVFPWLAEIG